MNVARFDLVTLNLFVAIARTGSITRGAHQANLALAAASKRISDLESHFGTSLLYRHATGVTLTDAGNACFQHVLGILQDVERMSGVMSDYASGVRGQVRIWANTSAITQFLPLDLHEFLRTHAGIRIDLEERNSGDTVAGVRENRTDIGIFAAPTPMDGVATFEYRKQKLGLVVPLDHPLATRKKVTLSDVLDYDFISLAEATSLTERLHAECSRLQKSLKLRTQVRSFDAVCRMVHAGMGVGVVPALTPTQARAQGIHFLRVDDAWAERTLLLAVRDVRALAQPVRLLASSLSSAAARALL
ncbi:LysR family transcriptional regulator [Herminiimonas fonticola]|uniref:LysR family transcriptional regulator n=1 Tax=Herminiimonas fonticola TaxID=303380 RepID=A0A4R6GK08_9BURK|nr:LysR family transcriptional regulator [Herminiimonas fonticola]RBA25401.1 Transcriptional regulator [Herminiimonas fonticola]TDN94515.1 LysR family transcriptional regulator [Herminiimonas fonticola]